MNINIKEKSINNNYLAMKKVTFFSFIFFLFGLALTAYAADVILGPAPTKTYVPITISSGETTGESVFIKNLTIGSSGKDIMALKKILGLELGIAVDTSPTFTSKTASDVKKLQEKYAVEILIPNGLSSGTGTVGPSTRTKLNQLASNYSVKLSDFTLPIVSTVRVFFTTTLKLGSSGDEVSLLKIVLNSDKDTKIITKSLDVTNIFDSATEIALNKFQEKYANEILTPSGLKKGIGTVGPSTRKKLNSILNNILVSTQTTTASTTNNQ